MKPGASSEPLNVYGEGKRHAASATGAMEVMAFCDCPVEETIP